MTRNRVEAPKKTLHFPEGKQSCKPGTNTTLSTLLKAERKQRMMARLQDDRFILTFWHRNFLIF
jgi:hypothetical protein